MQFNDVNNTYVRIKENERDIFYIKKSDVSKVFIRDGYISVIGVRGDEIYKVLWSLVDVFDETLDPPAYTIQNTVNEDTAENTLVAVHNAFFFRDGVGIDLEQLSNISGEPGNGYILVYDADSNKWVPQPVIFNTEDATDLSSNVSGLNKGKLTLGVFTDLDTQIEYRTLFFNDVSGTQHSVVLPSDVSDTGDINAISVVARNVDDGPIYAGFPIHFTGTQGSTNLQFVLAVASEPDRMPAHGILKANTAANESNQVVILGTVENLNTNSIEVADGETLEEGMTLYVRPQAGLTTIRPTDPDHLVQNIGALESVDNNQGKIVVTGPGRSNDVPNLALKNVFIGGDDGTETRQLSTDDLTEGGNKFYSDTLARDAISNDTSSTITYNSGTGVIGIDDSAYLTEVSPTDIQSAISGGDGIDVTTGEISAKLGDYLIFDSVGNITLGNSINISLFNNDAGYLTLSDLPELSAQTFTDDITVTLPNGGNLGKYSNTEVIPSAGKTAIEVLTMALTETVAPIPDLISITEPLYGDNTLDLGIVFDFGVRNPGSTGTAELQYSTTNSNYTTIETYGESDVYYGAPDKTFNHVFSRPFDPSNTYYYRIVVNESGFTRSDSRSQDHRAYQHAEFSDKSISLVAESYSRATGSSTTVREFGDVKSILKYKVKRKENIVGLYQSFITINLSGNNRAISGSYDSTVDTLPDESTTGIITFQVDGNETYGTGTSIDFNSENPHEYRVYAKSDPVPDTGDQINSYSSYSDINFYSAHLICAGPYFNDAAGQQPTAQDIQDIYDNKAATTNGLSEFKILTSGSYPSALGTTQSITEQDGNSLYIIYPGDTPISNILLNGSLGVLGAFTNWGQFNITNQFGITREYTVYASGPNAFNDDTLTIS